MTLLVAGYSARVLAQSARRGGWNVVAVDCFGDRDLAEAVPTRSVRGDLGAAYAPEALVDLARSFEADSVVYTGGLENHGEVVAALARDRELLGNDPLVLRRVRDWRLLRVLFEEEAIPFPQTLFPGEETGAREGRWLSKPVGGAGGTGLRIYGGERLREGRLLQEFLPGPPASATFLCDGRRSRLLGLTEQLVGHRALTEKPFAWCGNVFPLDISGEGRRLLERVGDVLARAFGLKGLNGVDFIVAERDGRRWPLPVEINPRPAASLEILESAWGGSLFPLHVAACRGSLPDGDLAFREGFWGKAVVYARRSLHVSCSDDWYDRNRRDIPHDGESVAAGSPVCTLLTEAESRDGCLGALLEGARALRDEIGDR